MKCSSCGSSQFKSLENYLVCRHGKVLKSFSHQYDKNSGYVIDNEKRDLKRQELYYNKVKSSRFMSVESEKN